MVMNGLRRIKRRLRPHSYASALPTVDYGREYFDSLTPNCKPPFWRVDTSLNRPTINVVLPSLNKEHLSGGPNTVLNLCCHLNSHGANLRVISINTELKQTKSFLLDHLADLTDVEIEASRIDFVDGFEKVVDVGPNDMFFGSAWWTVQAFKDFVETQMKTKKFFYMVQDYEPGFYPWGHEHAMALETYNLNHIPVVNSKSLFDYFLQTKTNGFSSDNSDLVFMPSVDSTNFYFDPDAKKKNEKTLLFYARPGLAQRNLYEIGVEALYRLSQQGLLNSEWNVHFMGERIPDVLMDTGFKVTCLDWMNYRQYGEKMREADVVLSLMLSPHPSYTPLEAAACGAFVVTNNYMTKTDEFLTGVSENIIPASPSVNSITQALETAVSMASKGNISRPEVNLPKTWAEAFEEVVPAFMKRFRENTGN